MNRRSLEYCVQRLKNKDNRFFYGFAVSCPADAVLAVFYFKRTLGFNGGNPHAHIMLTMRSFDERGAWGAKQKKEYILDKDGNRGTA